MVNSYTIELYITISFLVVMLISDLINYILLVNRPPLFEEFCTHNVPHTIGYHHYTDWILYMQPPLLNIQMPNKLKVSNLVKNQKQNQYETLIFITVAMWRCDGNNSKGIAL